MQIKNNYSIEYYDPASSEVQRGIYTGEMGRFQGFDVLTGKYDILFDGDRKIGFDKKNMSDIELSYAITVHKAQGCEFDRVTIVLGFMNSQLSSRKLLYTAVTRGKNKVTIIDSGERLAKIPASAYYVSPLGRARDTAEYTLRLVGKQAETLPWLLLLVGELVAAAGIAFFGFKRKIPR